MSDPIIPTSKISHSESDFLSRHVDWKKVITTGVLGAAALLIGNIGLNKVNEYAVEVIQKRLDTQRDFFLGELSKVREQINDARAEAREHDKEVIDAVRREQDQMHQELRDQRSRGRP